MKKTPCTFTLIAFCFGLVCTTFCFYFYWMGWEPQCSWRRQFYFYGLPQLLIHIQLTHIFFGIILTSFFSLRVYFSTMLLSLLSRLLPKSNSPTYSLESFLTHKPTIAYCMYILYLDIKLYLAKKSASCRSGNISRVGCNKIGSGVGGS